VFLWGEWIAVDILGCKLAEVFVSFRRKIIVIEKC